MCWSRGSRKARQETKPSRICIVEWGAVQVGGTLLVWQRGCERCEGGSEAVSVFLLTKATRMAEYPNLGGATNLELESTKISRRRCRSVFRTCCWARKCESVMTYLGSYYSGMDVEKDRVEAMRLFRFCWPRLPWSSGSPWVVLWDQQGTGDEGGSPAVSTRCRQGRLDRTAVSWDVLWAWTGVAKKDLSEAARLYWLAACQGNKIAIAQIEAIGLGRPGLGQNGSCSRASTTEKERAYVCVMISFSLTFFFFLFVFLFF